MMFNNWKTELCTANFLFVCFFFPSVFHKSVGKAKSRLSPGSEVLCPALGIWEGNAAAHTPETSFVSFQVLIIVNKT